MAEDDAVSFPGKIRGLAAMKGLGKIAMLDHQLNYTAVVGRAISRLSEFSFVNCSDY